MYRHPTDEEMGTVGDLLDNFRMLRGIDITCPPTKEETLCWVREEGSIDGVVCWKDGSIYALYVVNMYRCRGAGTALLHRAMQEIGEGVEACILPDWEDAKDFIARLGFANPVLVYVASEWTPYGKKPEQVLKHLRRNAALTVTEAAKRSGVSKSMLQKAEKDAGSVPASVISTLAAYYGVSAGYILTPEMEVLGK